ncbi:hypothetical protein ZHAS_00010104 [Anopheles sinensis]|uniref:Uncharacterized protein n=1 Tax=Anopheles sinensis TaxID=74873 RepID=A0A084VWR5_ANOSI|nr:hypothetical protein ZHAS_00010104 [Anopheles sinensis]
MSNHVWGPLLGRLAGGGLRLESVDAPKVEPVPASEGTFNDMLSHIVDGLRSLPAMALDGEQLEIYYPRAKESGVE